MGLVKILCILCIINLSFETSTPESPSYVAGVVEYQVDQGLNNDTSLTSDQIFEINTNKYMDILTSEEASIVDIIVFPENTLNRKETAVVIPRENEFTLDLCTNTTYDQNFRTIACAAKNLRKYIVINLTTKWSCVEERAKENDDEPCQEEWNLHNTNVVLNRDGVVISIYRKYHLFGEPGITQPSSIEYRTFDTDFGVRFGHFVCFDLLFQSPAMDMVTNGITNIIFPTRWYSELPFITAVQVQQNWAYVNNVNFLAAGANLPSIGTTGSGIYSGKLGSLTSIMTGENTTKLLVHEVPKIPGTSVEMTSSIYFGSNFDDLTLYQDVFDDYSYMPVLAIDFFNIQSFDLCSTFDGELFCCDFYIATSQRNVTADSTPYKYMAVAYSGWRHFNYLTYEGVKVCAVVACENDDILSCGKRINTSTQVSNIVFDQISIQGKFPGSSVLTMPSTLTFNISSLPPTQFTFIETLQGDGSTDIEMSTLATHTELLTFGIFARDFRYSSKDDPNAGSILCGSGLFMLLLPIVVGLNIVCYK